MKAESLLDLIQKIKQFRFILSDLILKKNQSEIRLISTTVTEKISTGWTAFYTMKNMLRPMVSGLSAPHRPSGILRKHQIRFTIINPIKIWKKGVIKTKGNTKGMLLYNIAVANEITGNTDEAVNNLKLSIAAFEKTPMVNYQHIFTVYQYQQALEKRLKEIELIKKQLGEVN